MKQKSIVSQLQSRIDRRRNEIRELEEFVITCTNWILQCLADSNEAAANYNRYQRRDALNQIKPLARDQKLDRQLLQMAYDAEARAEFRKHMMYGTPSFTIIGEADDYNNFTRNIIDELDDGV